MPIHPELTTLAYVTTPDRSRVLLVHRVARESDEQLGKYNGLGGKLEAHEDVVGCLQRELMEEAGITVTAQRLRGTISWPGFGTGGEDWFGFVDLLSQLGVLHSRSAVSPNEVARWAGTSWMRQSIVAATRLL